MKTVNETVVRYLAAWNERDPKRRRELVAATWTEEGSYIDAHRHGHGHSAIDAMLAATQAQFPNYRLNLVSGIEAHNNVVRFSWAAGGTAEAPLYIVAPISQRWRWTAGSKRSPASWTLRPRCNLPVQAQETARQKIP